MTVQAEVRASLEHTFQTIVPIDLASIFHGLGPLPAVVATREQTGAWDHAGATRVVEMADGSQAREELTAYAAPTHFAYRLTDFTGPLRHLARHVDGAWWFSSANGRTHIRWAYVFEPRWGRAGLIRLAVAPLWRAYATRALALAARAAEAPAI
ncbi:MAG TPA: SRPBCC family protein [Solirubrobacteraceae bacterium]